MRGHNFPGLIPSLSSGDYIVPSLQAVGNLHAVRSLDSENHSPLLDMVRRIHHQHVRLIAIFHDSLRRQDKSVILLLELNRRLRIHPWAKTEVMIGDIDLAQHSSGVRIKRARETKD